MGAAHTAPLAFVGYSVKFVKADVENELDVARDDYIEDYGIDKRSVTDEEIDRMAFELRRILDKDADTCWSYARAKAVRTVLDRRKHGYVIGRPINGITINGLECVLDENGDELVFDSIEDAKDFLSGCGIGEKEIEAQGIQFKEV